MDEYITIALPKGKLFDKSVRLLAKVGYSADNVTEDSRKLVISNEETKVRFIIAKTVDVPTYVEYGAADIGIIGKDVLLEQDKDVVELLDLGFGLDCPATGFALGVDRVVLALERAGSLKSLRSWDVLVAWSEGKLPEAIAKATALRQEGRSVKMCTEATDLAGAASAVKEYCCSSLVYVS